MRTIVHLSDLHFGRVDEGTTAPLVQQIRELNPDLVVISGDSSSLFPNHRLWFPETMTSPYITYSGGLFIHLENTG